MAIIDTTVVNMRTNAYDVAIDRSSPFGNPHHRDQNNDRNAVLALYRTYFYKRVDQDPEFKRRVLDLRGKRLGCWCSPMPCHGMIIVEWLETVGAIDAADVAVPAIENYYAARDAVKSMDFSSRSIK